MTKYNFATGDVAESIASAMADILSEELGRSVSVQKDQVVVEPTRNAGEFKITIYDNPEFASRVIPFMDLNGNIPTSMGELCPIGFETNRKLCKLDLRQHGHIVGESSSGKTSLLHVMLAHATRCPDCIIWVGGVWKLYNFMGPWLEIYKDTGIRPPFDWVAHGHEDVAEQMAAFLRIATHRQSLPFSKRADLPMMILVLDEVTFIVEDKYTKGDVHGELLTLSQMIARIARGTHEMDMFEWLATQRDTQDNLGPEGGTTAAQMGFSFVFRIRDQYTLGRVFNEYSLSQIKNRGEAWGDLGPDNPIVRLRVAYPQTDNIRKAILHNGPKISQISWARRDIPHVLDEGSQLAAGDTYADRFQLVDEDSLTYLRQVRNPTSSPVDTANTYGAFGVLPAIDESSAEWAAAAAQYEQRVRFYAGQNEPAPGIESSSSTELDDHSIEEPRTDNSGVPTLADFSQYKKRADRVRALVAANGANGGQPMKRGEIIDRLKNDFGDSVQNSKVVTNILRDLVKEIPPVIGKTDDDRYYSL